jgi:hypothetical protein
MFEVTKVHNRLYSVNGEYYWDGEPITEAEANHLRLHYKDTCAKLRAPWENKDQWYDELGRLNYAWNRQ